MKFTAILLPVALCLVLPGCAGSFSKVSGAVKDAPDWYDERRKEVRGEGYPELSEIPEIQKTGASAKSQTLGDVRIKALTAEFASLDARLAAAPSISDYDARIAKLRANLDAANRAPGAQMTEAQAEAIRKKFDVPRVTEPFKGKK